MNQRPPGFLRQNVAPDVIMMICTAGHVDHGKTKLVKLLTGCETDRLRAERERGLTIELGFAPCFLGGKLCVGVVDVPGHEKFIRNMVAGVYGIDLAILVVAADDGIMPQTVEHVQIMELVGVRHGIVALTKTDLVAEDEQLKRAAEVRAFVKGTFLEQAPICPVSSETFEGYPEFYETLVARVTALERRTRAGVFRMPIERVFNPKGFGTVVSGIPIRGSVKVGDRVELFPGNVPGQVRGIQCFLRDATDGGSGQCLALNIPDFDGDSTSRGQVVAEPGSLAPARFFHVRLRTVGGLEKPLRNAESVRVHTGTAEEGGRLYLLDGSNLPESQSTLATIAVDAPVAAAAGDCIIVRRLSPAVTVAGGEILLVSDESERPRKRTILAHLRDHERILGDSDSATDEGQARQIEYFLHSQGASCPAAEAIAKGTLLPLVTARARLAELAAAEKAFRLGAERYILAGVYAACRREVETRLDAAAADGTLTLEVSDLRRGVDWPVALWHRLQEDLAQAEIITVRGSTLLLRQSVRNLPDADRQALARISQIYDETAYHSPRPDELPALLDLPRPEAGRLLTYLCNHGSLIRLNRNVIISRRHFRRSQELVVDTIRGEGTLDSADFKLKIGSTRKYALAILDFLDAQRVTVRTGNDRRLTPDYEKRLL